LADGRSFGSRQPVAVDAGLPTLGSPSGESLVDPAAGFCHLNPIVSTIAADALAAGLSLSALADLAGGEDAGGNSASV